MRRDDDGRIRALAHTQTQFGLLIAVLFFSGAGRLK